MFEKIFTPRIKSNYDLINYLKTHNPDVEFSHDGTYSWVRPNVSVDRIRLPKPFYYNNKNGFTNKHRTNDGHYISVQVIW